MERRFWPRKLDEHFQLEPLEASSGEQNEGSFSLAMTALDIIHLLSNDLVAKDGQVEEFTVKIRRGDVLSDVLNLVNNPRSITMVMPFNNGNERNVSVRNGTIGVLYVLDKSESVCRVSYETSNREDWSVGESLDRNIDDILPLLQKQVLRMT